MYKIFLNKKDLKAKKIIQVKYSENIYKFTYCFLFIYMALFNLFMANFKIFPAGSTLAYLIFIFFHIILIATIKKRVLFIDSLLIDDVYKDKDIIEITIDFDSDFFYWINEVGIRKIDKTKIQKIIKTSRHLFIVLINQEIYPIPLKNENIDDIILYFHRLCDNTHAKWENRTYMKHWFL